MQVTNILLPAGGFWQNTRHYVASEYGTYWCTKRHSFPAAYYIYFNSSNITIITGATTSNDDRYMGYIIRAIK